LIALAVIAWPAGQAAAQPPSDAARRGSSVSVAGDALQVKVPAFTFIKGDALDRLKQGRPVRFDVSLTVLSRAGGPVIAQSRQSFNLSYDLWEERFAVTRIGAPPSSVSHLTSKDAEAWCLAHVPLSVSALGGLGRDAPFWIRLQSQIVAPDPTPGAEEEPLTLRGLIDLLSRRRPAAEQEDSMEAGPFRLPDLSRAPSSQ
jgi:hypothetical protein